MIASFGHDSFFQKSSEFSAFYHCDLIEVVEHLETFLLQFESGMLLSRSSMSMIVLTIA